MIGGSKVGNADWLMVVVLLCFCAMWCMCYFFVASFGSSVIYRGVFAVVDFFWLLHAINTCVCVGVSRRVKSLVNFSLSCVVSFAHVFQVYY